MERLGDAELSADAIASMLGWYTVAKVKPAFPRSQQERKPAPNLWEENR